jgi:hypothetical protein
LASLNYSYPLGIAVPLREHKTAMKTEQEGLLALSNKVPNRAPKKKAMSLRVHAKVVSSSICKATSGSLPCAMMLQDKRLQRTIKDIKDPKMVNTP